MQRAQQLPDVVLWELDLVAGQLQVYEVAFGSV